jgi:hypothetical protein
MESLEDPQIDALVLPRAYVPPSRIPELLFDNVFTGIVASDHPAVGGRLSAEQYRSLWAAVTYSSTTEGMSRGAEGWRSSASSIGTR